MYDTSMELNQEQLDAALHEDGPMLVLAGAGSGKTRIVTYRIAKLIERGVLPEEILAVTFTNKAAREMQERIHNLLHATCYEGYPTISTFHSLGVQILRESAHHLGYSNNFTIYDEEDTNKLLKGCLESLDAPKEKSLLKMTRSIISNSKNELLGPDDLDLTGAKPQLQQLVPQAYRLYKERLQQANALDFDDLLLMPVQLFRSCPEVLESYQRRWRYMSIDEYQDTNHAQYMLAKLLVSKSQNILVVGDPDQSIYSWRGANIKNILNFERDYPGAKTVRLEQNYRSRSNILDAANALIEHNQSRLEKNLWSDLGEGEMIHLFVAGNEKEEAAYVVRELEHLHDFHKIPLSEISIFYRTNFQSRIFEDFLLRRQIPYTIVGGISFYQRKEIKDVLAFLRVVESDCDAISFARTVNLPKRGIGPTTLQKIFDSDRANLLGPYSIKLTPKIEGGLREYRELIHYLRQVKEKEPLHKLVLETIRESRYLDVLREDKETYEDRKANVEELVAKAREWEGESLLAFLEELSLKSSLDEAEQPDDALNLMTVHNGKGLEFNTVFLVGMEEDLFPHVNSRDSFESVEEERRLCYVGMTRAKERLYLTAAETRFLWGQHKQMRPSRFLREIPRHYLERCDT
ncbi:MAG: ATP-dependent DNA helicase PcrA [Chlamydiales bacterium]|nr:ATP-dependent DNA helicase PcrA [Chlamydiales bacterium]MCH9634850.1 ATP-dependent DNA helicase PcrA [Chlamydiales bacterium]